MSAAPRPQPAFVSSKSRFDWRRFGSSLITFESILMFVFLYVPILILIVYSFNSSRFSSVWDQFTFGWYDSLFQGENSAFTPTGRGFDPAELLDSVKVSLIVAAASTVISTVLGTTLAMAMERFRFRFRSAIDIMLYLPVVIPEITMGLSLVVFYQIIADLVSQNSILGLITVIVGHVSFSISFVAIVVRARLAGMDRTLEEAAQDSGANEWQTFRRVVLPLIMPGILGGALLAFTLSLDDFVITFYTSGIGTSTMPLYVYGMIRRGISPAINALSTLMLGASIVILLISLRLQRR